MRRRTVLFVVLSLTVLVAFAVAAFALTARTASPDQATAATPTYPVVPRAPTRPAVTQLKVPPATPLPADASRISIPVQHWSPDADILTTTSGALWTSNGLWRIDPKSDAVRGPLVRVAASPDIGSGEGSLWASDYYGDVVRRVDPVTGKKLAAISLPRGSAPEGIADAAGAIWVATHYGGTLARIDPETNTLGEPIVLTHPGSSGPQGVGLGLGSVWVDVPNIGSVVRIDPTTSKIDAVIRFPRTMSPCGGIAVGRTAVWVSSCLGAPKVARIDPEHNRVASILDVGGGVVQPASDGNSVWFVAGGVPGGRVKDAYLIHLRADDTVAKRIDLGPGFISGGTAVAFGSVWVSDFWRPRVIHIPDTG